MKIRILLIFFLPGLLALASCGSRVSVEKLLSDNENVRQKAIDLLMNMPDESKLEFVDGLLEALRGTDSELNDRAVEILKKMGPAVVPAMKKSLSASDVFLRLCSIEVLSAIRGREDALTQDLLPSLEDPHPLVRSEAAYYLGKIGPQASAALPSLKKMVARSKETEDVKNSAREAILRIQPEPAEPISKKAKIRA